MSLSAKNSLAPTKTSDAGEDVGTVPPVEESEAGEKARSSILSEASIKCV